MLNQKVDLTTTSVNYKKLSKILNHEKLNYYFDFSISYKKTGKYILKSDKSSLLGIFKFKREKIYISQNKEQPEFFYGWWGIPWESPMLNPNDKNPYVKNYKQIHDLKNNIQIDVRSSRGLSLNFELNQILKIPKHKIEKTINVANESIPQKGKGRRIIKAISAPIVYAGSAGLFFYLLYWYLEQ